MTQEQCLKIIVLLVLNLLTGNLDSATPLNFYLCFQWLCYIHHRRLFLKTDLFVSLIHVWSHLFKDIRVEGKFRLSIHICIAVKPKLLLYGLFSPSLPPFFAPKFTATPFLARSEFMSEPLFPAALPCKHKE